MKTMKKTLAILLIAVGMSSCIGSFQLTNRVLDWNNSVDNKFVNELVFIGFHIVPVYQVTILADALVLNSIEFWGGSTNLSMNEGSEKLIESQGRIIRVVSRKNGYHLEQVGAEHISMELNYCPEKQEWSAVTSSGETKIMKRLSSRKVLMYLPENKSTEVELTSEGIAAFKMEQAPAISAAL
jgi:hypothetical protein